VRYLNRAMVVPLVKNLGTLVTYSHTHSLAVVEFTRDFLLNPVGLLAHMVLPNSSALRPLCGFSQGVGSSSMISIQSGFASVNVRHLIGIPLIHIRTDGKTK